MLEVLVTANYLDDFNQPQQFTQILSLQVDQPATPEPQSGGTQGTDAGTETFWQRIGRFFRALFGLGS